MYAGGNVRTTSERDGDAAPADEGHEPEERHSSYSTRSTPETDRHFREAFEKYGGIDSDKERPASRLSDDATFEERRAHSIKTLDQALDKKISEYETEQEDQKAFASKKAVGARDYLSAALSDQGKFSDIIEKFLEYGRAFKKDPIDAAEHFIRDFRSSRFRADRAEQLKVDRTPPEIQGHRRDWLIEQSMGHVERGDDLTKAQIKELKSLFPGTSLDGILDNIATLAREGFADPMNVAAKLAHATGAPRTEAELETWQQQETQRQQQVQTDQARQREVGQYLHNTATRIMQLPQFPRSGSYETDYRAAHHAAQTQYQEHVEMEGAQQQIAEFAARRDKPYFDVLRPAMAAHLQAGNAADLEQAYNLAIAPWRDVANPQAALAEAKKAAPIRSSTGSGIGANSSTSRSGLSGHLSAAIDRYTS